MRLAPTRFLRAIGAAGKSRYLKNALAFFVRRLTIRPAMGNTSKNKMLWAASACLALGLVGCTDEDGVSPQDAAVFVDGGGMAGMGGTAPKPDAAVDAIVDAPVGDTSADVAVSDAGVGDAGGADAAPLTAQQLRGSYLVNTVLSCGDCHTPRNQNGPIPGKFLSGNQCFIDINPTDDTKGCLATKNLTHHLTGLATRSDQQIKDMFTKGIRPDGKAMHSVMPYYQFALLSDVDADSIVAYLRTVPGVENMIGPNQAPWDMQPPAAATLITAAEVPAVPADAMAKASAEKGRYLASVACLECHTPELPMGSARPVDVTKAFTGNKMFKVGPFTSYSSNLTSDATGLAAYSAADIVKALKIGIDKNLKGLCPPMPAGMAGFGKLTDDDAMDIANYIKTLAPVANAVTAQCEVPAP